MMRRIEIVGGMYKDETGYIHQWVSNHGDILAIVELKNGRATGIDIGKVKFLNTPEEPETKAPQRPQESARQLQEYCKKHTDCTGCMFEYNGKHSYCRLFDNPDEWKLLEE